MTIDYLSPHHLLAAYYYYSSGWFDDSTFVIGVINGSVVQPGILSPFYAITRTASVDTRTRVALKSSVSMQLLDCPTGFLGTDYCKV